MFEVPPDAPTTVKEKFGKVHYKIRVVFDRPSKFDLEFRKFVVVIRPYDLNSDSKLKNPLEGQRTTKLGNLFSKPNPMTLTVTVPQTGYIIGQMISIKVNIDNQTSFKINQFRAILKKNVVYTSETPKLKVKNEEIILCREKINSEGKSEFYVNMKVPNTVPSTITPSSQEVIEAIKVHYQLIVIAKVSFSCIYSDIFNKFFEFLTDF